MKPCTLFYIVSKSRFLIRECNQTYCLAVLKQVNRVTLSDCYQTPGKKSDYIIPFTKKAKANYMFPIIIRENIFSVQWANKCAHRHVISWVLVISRKNRNLLMRPSSWIVLAATSLILSGTIRNFGIRVGQFRSIPVNFHWVYIALWQTS